MKKRAEKKLSLHRETIANLKQVVGGAIAQQDREVFTDTDRDTVPSGGPAICWISDCNPCPQQEPY